MEKQTNIIHCDTKNADKEVDFDPRIKTQTIVIKRKEYNTRKYYANKIAEISDHIYKKFFTMVGFYPRFHEEMKKWMFHHFKTQIDASLSDDDMNEAIIVYYQKAKANREQKMAEHFDPTWPVFRKYKKAILFQFNTTDKEKVMVIRYRIFK